MNVETQTLLLGAAAGGVVSLAVDGLKSWFKRSRLEVTASMPIASRSGEPPHYRFEITLTNTGGTTLHIVRYGILGPKYLQPRHRVKIRKIKQLHTNIEGFKGRLRRVKLFDGLFDITETVVLSPGQPHTMKIEWIDDWIGVELRGYGIAFAQDSLGRKYKATFQLSEYSALSQMRTPEEHDAAQQRAVSIVRVDKFGNLTEPDPVMNPQPERKMTAFNGQDGARNSENVRA